MVGRRSVPLGRRLRAIRGHLVLGSAWGAAVVVCLILGQLQPVGVVTSGVALRDDHPVRAPESGRLLALQVAPGQVVAAGDTVAVVEVPGLTSLLEAAEAELGVASAGGAGDLADRARRYERDVEAAQAQLASRRADLARAQALLVGAEAEVARAGAPGVGLSEQSLSRIQASAEALRAEVRGLESEVGTLTAGLSSARARRDAFRAGEGATEVEVLRARRDSLQARVEALTLRAPTAGVVGLELPAAGEWVQGGMPVALVEGSSTQDAVAYVDATRVGSLAPGATVRVRPASGGEAMAVVRTIGPGVQAVPGRQSGFPAVPSYGVPVLLTVSGRALIPGESLAVEF